MTYRTKFKGYTPESDLSAADWRQIWNAVNTATVLGIAKTYIGSDTDTSNLTTYSFDPGITEIGRYVVGVFGSSTVGAGVSSVSIDGQSGTEVLDASKSNGSLAFHIIDLQSFGGGSVSVTFDSAQTSAAVAVWKVTGRTGNTADDTETDDMGTTDIATVDTRSVLCGIGQTEGDASAAHFWAGLTKDLANTNVEGDVVISAASDIRDFSDTSYEVGAYASGTSLDTDFWGAIVLDTEYTYFPAGSGALFEKQTSDALSFWAWSAVSALADVEVLALIRPTAEGATSAMGVVLRGSGSAGAENGYVARLNLSGGTRTLDIVSYLAGSAATPGSEAFTYTTDTNYWIRFRAQGTTLQAKVWAESGDEPDDWTIEITNSTVSNPGKVGIYQQYTATTFEVGQFEAKQLYASWPSAVPQNWDMNISGGPQVNKIEFTPATGPTIDRRRSSSKARNYQVECPGLTLTEYTAFVTFYETTLVEGTLPFMYTDPFTNLEKTFKFVSGGQDPAYTEEIQVPPGSDGTGGLYKVAFNVMRLD